MASTATADALVDAAEALFAVEGFEAASLRAVMRAARSDSGAIHYHFGGREELAAAVLARVLGPLNARRLELLTGLEQEGLARPVPLASLVDAIVRPDIEVATDLRQRGAGRARLIGAVYISPATFVKSQVEHHFGPVAGRFMPHLIAAVPAVPDELLSWRIRWCLFGLIGALLSDEDEPFTIPTAELLSRIVAAGTAAIAAPVGPTTTSGE
ncbi:MAG: TetR/AcrR family transcriptional regulator [Acidimicrobiales bacterium]